MTPFNIKLFKTPGIYTEEINGSPNRIIFQKNHSLFHTGNLISNGNTGNGNDKAYLLDELLGDLLMSENNEIIEQEI